MRFWSRQPQDSSQKVKPTQPHQRNHKAFDQPTIRHQRPFSNTMEEDRGLEKIPSIQSMDIHPPEPIDQTRGGQDELPPGLVGVALPSYNVTNLTTDRAYDADATSTDELADVLGTLIKDVSKALRELDRRTRHART